MRIQTWLKKIVCNPAFANLIWWHCKEKGLIAIHWKHASYEDYDAKDSVLFREWAIENNRYDSTAQDSPEERKRWKTNFRCALHSATNIRNGESHCCTKSGKRSYRLYELLDEPDPDKVNQKKRSNKQAAKSKLKSDNEKRSYNSRLNKVKNGIKKELTAFDNENEESDTHRLKLKKPKGEPMEVCTTAAKYDYRNYIPEYPEEHAAQLPSTLEQFHEEEREDAGYCSFSDSSSINSQESSFSDSSSIADPTRTHVKTSTNIQLEPVETIFHPRNFDRNNNLTSFYGQEFYECDIGDDAGDVYVECGEWGSEVMQAPCINSPNVITQFYEQKIIEIYSGARHDTHYSLTSL